MALRAGSVGPGCEVGLGPSRGWGSGRPVSPPRRLPPESVARGVSPPRQPLPALCSGGPAAGALGGAGGAGPGGRLYARRRTAGRARGGPSGAAAATLDVRRALLADLPGYGPRRDPRFPLPSSPTRGVLPPSGGGLPLAGPAVGGGERGPPRRGASAGA